MVGLAGLDHLFPSCTEPVFLVLAHVSHCGASVCGSFRKRDHDCGTGVTDCMCKASIKHQAAPEQEKASSKSKKAKATRNTRTNKNTHAPGLRLQLYLRKAGRKLMTFPPCYRYRDIRTSTRIREAISVQLQQLPYHQH